jgi:DDE domain
LNYIIEQDHRGVKQRVYPMLGFKGFRDATNAIKGIELAQKIREGQCGTSGVIVREGARVPHMWGEPRGFDIWLGDTDLPAKNCSPRRARPCPT